MIMKFMKHRSFIAIASAMAFSASVTGLYADMVTEWNANLESSVQSLSPGNSCPPSNPA